MHYTTLSELRCHDACQDRYAVLVAGLGADWPDDRPIQLIQILDICGLDDAIWALGADLSPARDRDYRTLACAYAWRALPVWQRWYQDDDRPLTAIVTALRYAAGMATAGELAVAWKEARAAAEAAAVAWSAAAAAEAAAAAAAAWAEAWAAAAWAEAWAAAAAETAWEAAAWAALATEREAQAGLYRQIIGYDDGPGPGEG